MSPCRHRRVEVGISKTIGSCLECDAVVDLRSARPETEVVDTLPIPRWRRAILLVLVVLEELVAGEPNRAQGATSAESSARARARRALDSRRPAP
jgi:hypothetical protein